MFLCIPITCDSAQLLKTFKQENLQYIFFHGSKAISFNSISYFVIFYFLLLEIIWKKQDLVVWVFTIGNGCGDGQTHYTLQCGKGIKSNNILHYCSTF